MGRKSLHSEDSSRYDFKSWNSDKAIEDKNSDFYYPKNCLLIENETTKYS